MLVSFLLKGFVVGFAIAAPVGPIGVLCIRRTLAEGRLSGLASGLGAATADAIYGAVAALGLTLVSGFLVSHSLWFRLVGGLFLVYLGVRTVLAAPAEIGVIASGRGLIGGYVSTFFLTLTNPMTILAFGAIFAGLQLAGAGGTYTGAAALVGGVFLGSCAWWLTLSTGVGLLRRRLNVQGLRWVNRASGLIILGFGLLALLSVRVMDGM